MERSPAKKLLIVLLTVLLGVFLMGIVADAHFPGKACENETPLAKNKHCSEGHGGEDPDQCSDGEDNDGDGLIDEEDPDCGAPPPPEDECTDGIDNDNDGATDGFDRDCDDGSPESGSDEPQCSDGVDNDDDGATDFGEGGDPDCESDDDDSEAGETPPPEPTCGDPDGDGVDHSAFDPDSNEGGLASSVVHGLDQALPAPVGGDQGVVAEVNCALIVTVEEILGVNG